MEQPDKESIWEERSHARQKLPKIMAIVKSLIRPLDETANLARPAQPPSAWL
jgi:hypothetical protein